MLALALALWVAERDLTSRRARVATVAHLRMPHAGPFGTLGAYGAGRLYTGR